MFFTDYDLKMVKEAIQHCTLNPCQNCDRFKALLARLEAGEKLHKYADHLVSCAILRGSACDCGLKAVQAAWRRSAGVA